MRWTTTKFDVLSRPVRLTLADNTVTNYYYDPHPMGVLTSRIDALGRYAQTVHGAAGRLLATIGYPLSPTVPSATH